MRHFFYGLVIEVVVLVVFVVVRIASVGEAVQVLVTRREFPATVANTAGAACFVHRIRHV